MSNFFKSTGLPFSSSFAARRDDGMPSAPFTSSRPSAPSRRSQSALSAILDNTEMRFEVRLGRAEASRDATVQFPVQQAVVQDYGRVGQEPGREIQVGFQPSCM